MLDDFQVWTIKGDTTSILLTEVFGLEALSIYVWIWTPLSLPRCVEAKLGRGASVGMSVGSPDQPVLVAQELSM